MKVSKLYSNLPDLFVPIEFNEGLNVVLAEIRLPENREKDTHNLGKTTLGRLLDFTLLAGRDADFFLFKHGDRFNDFVFYIEIQLEDNSYVTVRRSVSEASRINFKRHKARLQDFTDLDEKKWDHSAVPFEKAKEILDGILDWRAVQPWSFRKGLGYLLRSQDDYRDVFQLQRFASKHADWKPFLAHILGFDATLITEHYQKEEELSAKREIEQTVKREVGGSVEDISKVDGILLLKHREAEKKQKLLDAFDFRSRDKAATKEVVDQIDDRISALNSDRYSINHARRKIQKSLGDGQILFDPDEAAQLFQEAGVLFPDQLKADFTQLIEFNRSITEERSHYLREELEELDAKLKTINAELTTLGKKRIDLLSFISSTDVFSKFKRVSNELVALRSDITVLERQRGFLQRLQQLRSEIRVLSEAVAQFQSAIEEDVETQNSDEESLFSSIRLFLNEAVEEVINRKALLSVSPNRLGHLDFRAEILDELGNATSADLGHTYRKLMCVAFDLAVLRGHLTHKFPKFAYHDGVFESLDDRKKENLIDVIRRYMDLGLQLIITTIDSDLPERGVDDQPIFSPEEIVLTLHDEGDDGRLFRIPSW